MTSPGVGGTNVGTATGTVRINYESSNVSRATKDLQSFQSAMASTGSAGAQSAKGVAQATGAISQLQAATKNLGAVKAVNPLAGMGQAAQKEAALAQGAITKAMADYQKQVVKAFNINAPVKISPKDVTIDRTAFTKAIEAWKRDGAKQLTLTTLTGSIRFNPTVAVDTAGAATAGKKWRDAFDSASKQGSTGGGKGGGGLAIPGGAGASEGAAGLLGLLSKVTLAAGAAGIAVGGVGIALTKGFSRLQSIDDATNKLKILGLTAGQIKSVSDSALASVKGTAFGLDEAFSTAATAINAGVKPGQQLNKYLEATANTAALAGVGMNELGQSFSRAATQGKLTGEIAQTLYDRQVPLLKLLADEYGVTQQKAQQMVSNGEVDFNHFIDAMSKTGGAAKAMGNTIGGSFNNLKASVSRLGAGLLAPLFGKKNADDATVIAAAIQKVTGVLDAFGNWVKSNTAGVIDFWVGLGKVATLAGQAITVVVGGALEGIGQIVTTLSYIPRLLADFAEFTGQDQLAKDTRGNADAMKEFGDNAKKGSKTFQGYADKLGTARGELDKWGQAAKDAAAGTGQAADAAEDAAPKFVSVADALDVLQIKADAAEKGLTGTTEEFKDFLKTVKDKGGTDALLKTLTDMRTQFDNGGRQIKSYADAIDKMKDSTATAADKATTLIDALKGLGVLPGGDALASYNEEFDKMTSYTSTLIDNLDTTGDALSNLDGTLNLNTGNGRALLDQIEQIRQKMVELVSSGEASPDEAYQRTVTGLQQVLQNQANISPDQAQKIIDKYLPKDAILKSISAADPKSAIEELFKNDPAKLQSELNLLTTSQDIIKQIVGPDGQLHVPTVLDTSTPDSATTAPPSPPAPPAAPPGPPAPTPAPPKPPPAPAPGSVVPPSVPGGKPTIALPGQTTAKTLPEILAESGIIPSDTVPGTPGPSVPAGSASRAGSAGSVMQQMLDKKKLEDLAAQANVDPTKLGGALDDPANISKLLTDNPDLKQSLQPIVDQAQQSGQSFSAAFAAGIDGASDEVKKAILRLAGLAGDGLGNSPAKYGPLSGKGWSLNRGKTFTTDWAKGIASESDQVEGAVSDTAGAAAGAMGKYGAGGSGPSGGPGTLHDTMTGMLKDLQEFSDLGKHLLDFGKQIGDLVFSAAKTFNDLSGGALFPKSYKPDPTIKPKGSTLPGWNPTTNPAMQPGTNGSPTAPGTPGTQATPAGGTGGIPITQKADGTWTSTNPEWAKLIARESGGDPTIPQKITDSNSGGNEASGLFQIAKGTWASNGGLAFAPTAGEATPAQQAQVAGNIFAQSGGSPWGSGPNDTGRESDAALRAGLTTTGATPFTPPAAPAPGPITTAAAAAAPPPASGLQPTTTAGVLYDPVSKGFFNGVGEPIDAKGAPKVGLGKYTGTLPTTAPAPLPMTPTAAPTTGTQPTVVPTVPYGVPHGTDTGGYGSGGKDVFPQWLQDLGKAYGVTPSTYPGHQEGSSHEGEAGYASNPNALNRGVDWTGTPAQMQAFAKAMLDYGGTEGGKGGLEQVIYQAGVGGQKYGLGGAGNIDPGYYPQSGEGSYDEHQNHVHTRFGTSIPLPGQVAGPMDPNAALQALAGQPGQPGSPLGPLQQIAQNTNGLPTMPAQLSDLIGKDPELQAALSNTGALNQQTVEPVLQKLDVLQNQQTQAGNTGLSTALGGYKSQLSSQFGVKEGPSTLDQASSIFGSAAGIAGDVFAAIDSGLKFAGGLQDAAETFSRGVANSGDVMKLVDDVQTGLDFASKVLTAAGSITSTVGSLASIGAGADFGASGAVSAAGQILQLAGAAVSAINTGIDVAQEVWKISTKYLGRLIQGALGLEGSSDVRYLLDEVTGQVAAYSSDNPQKRSYMDTLGKALGAGGYSERPGVQNNLTVYQGPGQDPRDTMDDAMFTIRASGVGAFGGDAL